MDKSPKTSHLFYINIITIVIIIIIIITCDLNNKFIEMASKIKDQARER